MGEIQPIRKSKSALPEQAAPVFSYAVMAKKGVVFIVNALAAWATVYNVDMTPEMKTGLGLVIGGLLAMARNKMKMVWPEYFSWL